MPKQGLWICGQALTHTCTHAFMQNRHFKDPVVFPVSITTLTGTLHQAVPTWGPEQVYMYSLNLKVSGLDRMVVSAPRTTEAICVEEMEHPNTWCHWVSRIRPVWERNSSNLLIYSCKCNEKCESECTVSVTLAVNKAANEIRAFFTAEQCRRHAGSRSRLNNRPVLTASCLSGDMREKRNAHVTKMWQQLLTHGLTSCCPTNLESRKE